MGIALRAGQRSTTSSRATTKIGSIAKIASAELFIDY
jgi:hypothetical protein